MFDFFKRDKKLNPDASKLLASILVLYPSIQSVTYDSESDMLELSFALNGKISRDYFEKFLERFAESVNTFQYIEKLQGAKMELSVEGAYSTWFFHVRRDVSTLNVKEIALFTELTANYFGEHLLEDVDNDLASDEDYILEQEDYLEQCFNNIRQLRIEGRLVGVREQERVIIYTR